MQVDQRGRDMLRELLDSARHEGTCPTRFRNRLEAFEAYLDHRATESAALKAALREFTTFNGSTT